MYQCKNIFLECWCASFHILGKQEEELLLYLWRSGIKTQESNCRKLWEDLRHCILYVRSEIWIKFGCRPFVAPKFQELWQAMDETKFCLFKANISENILGQVEKGNFRWCKNLTTIREPRLKHKIKCYRKKWLGRIWQRLQKLPI